MYEVKQENLSENYTTKIMGIQNVLFFNINKYLGVTSCAHLTDGRLFSAGMDSACMVWDAK